MKTVTFISALLLASATLQAQPKAEGYQFTTVVNQKVTPVKNQAATGTCWCFATTSFIEAELLRQGKGEFDLSEMYIVRQKYMNQLNDNYLRHGKGNIGQGSISPSWVYGFHSGRHRTGRSVQRYQLQLPYPQPQGTGLLYGSHCRKRPYRCASAVRNTTS